MNNENNIKISYNTGNYYNLKERIIANALMVSIFLGTVYNAWMVEPKILPEESSLSILEEESDILVNKNLGESFNLVRKVVKKRAKETKESKD